jgi:hypothetical protein
MVAPRYYRSDDAGAPALTGQAGTLIAVLDACLVNGYGSKPGAGWTKPYSGTNLAAYRMGSGGSAERMYLRVDDSATLVSRVRGFVTMTDISAGTEPFPTDALLSGGAFVSKSLTENATTRPWFLVATPTLFIFHIDQGATVIGQENAGTDLVFGEYEYFGTGFFHHVMLDAQPGHNPGQSTGASFCARINPNSPQWPANSGRYVARDFTNIVGSAPFHKHIPLISSRLGLSPSGGVNQVAGAGSLLRGPDPVTGQVYFVRGEIITAASGQTARMGQIPGVWFPVLETFLGEHLGRISGTGALSGQELLIARTSVTIGGSSALTIQGVGQYAVSLTDW